MKKIISIIIIVFLIIGCKKDFVDRLPTTQGIIENFYRTQEDASQAVTAIYNMMLREDYASSIILSEVASDNCAGGAGSTDGGGYQLYDRGLQQPDADGNGNRIMWTNCYGGIYRANAYLQNEGNVNWKGNNELRLQYQAEARFLRAYFHFYLTRLFGEIPFLDHPLSPTEMPGRTPAEELFSKIIDDLRFCADHGLSAKYEAMKPDNWGRATKWAAEAMIARVYLYYSGYYNKSDIKGYTAANARDAIDDVIKNSGHALVDTFARLWIVPAASQHVSYVGEVNPEVIWSLRYVIGGGLNTFQRMIGPRNTNKDPYGQGWGACPVLPTLWEAYDSTDSRRVATILSWSREKKVYDYITNTQAQYTGYNLKKYELLSRGGHTVASNYGDWQINGGEDIIVLRFADVLLMGAELYLITNGDNNGTALNYINQVRTRAFEGDISHNYTTLSIDDIFRERRFELVIEDSRYWDILRSCKGDFSKLVNILTYVDPNDAANFSIDANSAETEFLNVDGNNFANHKGLFQIPQSEIDLMNGAITQNPGYN